MELKQKLKTVIEHPKLAFRGFNRLYHTRFHTRDHNSSGDDVIEEDWDNLLILDACRFDMFEERNTIEGKLETRTSKGSSTVEFLRGNFRGRDLKDTVYLTANPQYTWNIDGVEADFFKVIDLWEEDEYWDDEYNTVRPEKVTEKAKEVAEEHPDKRLIVHFMQPHYPFIASDSAVEDQKLSNYFWHNLMRGNTELPKEDVWDLYNQNLENVLPEAKDLVESLNGRTVVTSDHGNFVGERASPFPVREWGHPIGIYDEKLVKVPWLVIDSDERKQITSEEKEDEDRQVDEEAVKEKLEGLGYR